MPITNLSNKKIMSEDFVVCSDIFTMAKGLMFSRKQERALVFKFKKERKISLHMLFVFYPIDVLFLNKEKTVVGMKENFMPFTFYKSKKEAMFAVELNEGDIKKTKTMIGDKIRF